MTFFMVAVDGQIKYAATPIGNFLHPVKRKPKQSTYQHIWSIVTNAAPIPARRGELMSKPIIVKSMAILQPQSIS